MVNPRPSRKYIILEPLVLALVMVIGISIGYKINDTEDDFALIQRLDESAVPIGRIEEILRFVENKYVDSIDTEKIENQLIETVLQDLDPHSIYIPPTDLEDVNYVQSEIAKLCFKNNIFDFDIKLSEPRLIMNLANYKSTLFYYKYFGYRTGITKLIYNIFFNLKKCILILKNNKYELKYLKNEMKIFNSIFK